MRADRSGDTTHQLGADDASWPLRVLNSNFLRSPLATFSVPVNVTRTMSPTCGLAAIIWAFKNGGVTIGPDRAKLDDPNAAVAVSSGLVVRVGSRKIVRVRVG